MMKRLLHEFQTDIDTIRIYKSSENYIVETNSPQNSQVFKTPEAIIELFEDDIELTDLEQ